MTEYPVTYLISVALALFLLGEVWLRGSQPWRVPCLAVLATVAIWYLVEPIYSPETLRWTDPANVSDAFLAVTIFLVAFRILVPLLAPSKQPPLLFPPDMDISARKLLLFCAALWLALLAAGTLRMNGDIFAALFPNGRTGQGSMWARAGVSSGNWNDTFVTIAGYLYILLLASFGVLINFVRNKWAVGLCILIICVSWPYVFLEGARNRALATIGPGVAAFLLYSRVSKPAKAIVAIVAFLVVEELFRYIIAFRNVGFFGGAADVDVNNTRHLGLNMASELTYILGFLRNGTLQLQWGLGYLNEFTQFIPRSLWPNKPFLALDYAVVRGFGGNSASASGVFASISQGLIGQGVRQFGLIGGPIAVAILMAFWVRILTRLRGAKSLPRLWLYLVGLGLTFNLGRDVTLLVLWPFLLGFVGVQIHERMILRGRGRDRRLAAYATSSSADKVG